MDGGPTAMIRLVRCPRCSGILSEPPDVPVYACGGCGVCLKAKEEARRTNLLERVQSLSDELVDLVSTAVIQILEQDSIVEIDENSSVSVDDSTRPATKHVENMEWLLLSSSLILEVISAIFEQLDYALLGMAMAFLGLMLCMVELTYKARKEWATFEWRRGSLPWIYSHYPRHKLFGTTMEYFGLAAALWQLFQCTFGYLYIRHKSQNPIKMSMIMFLLCLCLLVSKLVKKYSSAGPLRELGP